LGADLIAAVDEALDDIADAPTAHPPWQVHAAFRRRLVRRFPYLVFYVVASDHVRVVAIAHAKRRPGYWRDRE
jgi:plasmid stabilization system protein ParE